MTIATKADLRVVNAWDSQRGMMRIQGRQLDDPLVRLAAQARAAACEECAAMLDRAAELVAPPDKRTNAIDRHTADVLRTKAASIRAAL